VRLQQALAARFGGDVRLRAGLPGALDVKVDGQLVYSKRREGHLTPDEIMRRVAARATPRT
jgi:hypothetical protein